MKAIGRSLRGRCLSRDPTATPRPLSSSYTSSRTFTKPAFAPKPIIDIKHIRNAPGLYEQNCIDRNYGAHAKNSWRIIELQEQWLALQQSARDLRSRNKALRDQIAKGGEEKDKALAEAKAMKAQLSELEAKETQLQEEIEGLAQDLPNLSSVHTPVGTEAALVDYIGRHPDPDNTKPWKSHVDIGQQLGILDFSGASQTSGWGWYFLVGDGAMLEQALVQYALSVARRKKWKVVAPPSLVYSHIASACGFQPRDQNGEQQVYAIEQSEKDKAKPQLALAGTAEIPLAGMKANTVLNQSALPLKTVGVSRCYRAEAGARGADTKGLYRVHEFTKVEMFAWTAPDQTGDDHFTAADAPSSETVFEEMLSMQHEIRRAIEEDELVLSTRSPLPHPRDAHHRPRRQRHQEARHRGFLPLATLDRRRLGRGHIYLDVHRLPEPATAHPSAQRQYKQARVPLHAERHGACSTARVGSYTGEPLGRAEPDRQDT